MKPLEHAKWIWCNNDAGKDEYGEFICEFDAVNAPCECRISCDGDYALELNGVFVESGQYGDFEHYKIYDTIDLTPYLLAGKNRMTVTVWHFGGASQRYRPAPAGLIFEVVQNDNVIAQSDAKTLSRKSLAYENGRMKKITGQLGYGYAYNAAKEDDWKRETTENFHSSTLAEKDCILYPRPIKKQVLAPMIAAKEIRNDGKKNYIFDLGKEVVGLFSLDVFSKTEQRLTISYSEHLENGEVYRIVEKRDFSFEYTTKVGENHYVNPFLRLACRYIGIVCEDEIDVTKIGLIPQSYPVNTVPLKATTEEDQKIIDLCVNTLRLCMMEHYVDCPWREQCLYAFDSRNQMLCGYKVFEGGNAEYVRANLKLMSQDTRDDDLLSICFPSGTPLTIPSFSLYYILSVNEYLKHTGDKSLPMEVYPRLIAILGEFLKRRENGLAVRFEGKDYWNFYDWSPYSDGTLGRAEVSEPDAALNCGLILALDALKEICDTCALPFPYAGAADELRRNVKDAFFCPETGLLTMRIGTEEYTDLANVLAILAGVVSSQEASVICDAVTNEKTAACSLSMRIFKYDALLSVNADKYRDYILSEIRRDYKKMIDAGSDCTWETIDGSIAFNNAGSLCHGWSAIPLLYLPLQNA